MVSDPGARVIARAPIAAGSIAGRRRERAALGADFVVPAAVNGLVALDRRAMWLGAVRDDAVAGDRDRVSRALRGAVVTGAGDIRADAVARTGEGVVRAG